MRSTQQPAISWPLAVSLSGGYAVEFDTFNNTWDPTPNNHVGILGDCYDNHLLYSNLNIEDNNWHHVKVNFDGGHIIVNVDSVENVNFNIPGFLPFNGFFGFTAATGLFNNWHIIDNIKLTLLAGTISGFVTDSSQIPIQGVKVKLKKAGTLIDEATTDVNGYYEFKELADGKYVVIGKKSGFTRDKKIGKVIQLKPWGKDEFINLVLE